MTEGNEKHLEAKEQESRNVPSSSIALQSHYNLRKDGQTRRPIWHVEPEELFVCDANLDLRDQPCCRNVTIEENVELDRNSKNSKRTSWARFQINTDVMRDIIIGLSDGLTVPFALTAGLSGTGNSRLVLLAGVAELISGSISMGVGGYLSAKTEYDHYHIMEQRTNQRVQQCCTDELQAEVSSILEPYGVQSEVAHVLGQTLRTVELQQMKSTIDNRPLASFLRFRKNQSGKRKEEKKVGLTPFLLQMGQGLEPISSWRVYSSAITIGFSYLFGGLIPLLPYIICHSVNVALFISIGVTGLTLILFGAVKQQLVDRQESKNLQPWSWKQSIFGSLSILAVGGAAAGASYGIVRAIEGGKKLG